MKLILALAVLMQALALLMAVWQLRRGAPRRGSVGMSREADASSEGRAGREDRSGGSPATDRSDPRDHPSARSAEYTIWLVLIRARSPDPAERLLPATHLQAQERAESAGCGDGRLPPRASADWRLGPSGCSCAAAPRIEPARHCRILAGVTDGSVLVAGSALASACSRCWYPCC